MKRLKALRERKRQLEAESQTSPFRHYRNDPLGFADKLGIYLWSKQREIVLSVLNNRRTAVQSCHDVGKSFGAGFIGAWWLSTNEPGEAFFVSLAPTARQVKNILWREMGRLHRQHSLPGRMNLTEWLFGNEIVGFGVSPKDTDPTAIQGIHAARVLFLVDEACGVSRDLLNAGDTIVANEASRVLYIGNPDDPVTGFGEACKPGSGFNVIKISAFESPNFTGEKIPESLKPLLVSKIWVEEKRRSWGEGTPLYLSKVLGEFPEESDDGLIPLGAIRAAINRGLADDVQREGEIELGVDVARFGSDGTKIYARWGNVAQRIGQVFKRDTMEVTGLVIKCIEQTGATRVKIDDTGLGGGVTDRLNELRVEGAHQAEIIPVNVGEGATDESAEERFYNLRVELNWYMRERFVSNRITILPALDDPTEKGTLDLQAQAAAIKYKLHSDGRIKLVPKADTKAELKMSPDDWDALVLAFSNPSLGGNMILPFQNSDFLIDPVRIPSHWQRICVVDCDMQRFGALFGARDRATDTVYLYDEIYTARKELPVHADALRKRGCDWIPVLLELEARGRAKSEGQKIAQSLGVTLPEIFVAEIEVMEAAVAEVALKMRAGQIKVFSTLLNWREQQRLWRRNSENEIIEDGNHLMRATVLMLNAGLNLAISENAGSAVEREEFEDSVAAQSKNKRGGY